ncbi:MAG: NAD(P)-dependent oxidoreductase [Acidimicrobiales bacterium]
MEAISADQPIPVAVLPDGPLADRVRAAVQTAGFGPTDDPKVADCLVWCSWRPAGLAEILAEAPHVRWVQLPYAGVEAFLTMMHDGRIWTCAKDVYGPKVAELALGLLVSCFRRIDRYACATSWEPLVASTLRGSSIVILGAGGIGRSLAEMLHPLRANVTLVSRSGSGPAGTETIPSSKAAPAIATADAVVLALPLTVETRGMVDRSFLENMKSSAWLVNVARGQVVVTDDLVRALESGAIAGAALDVTDPEPLPEQHPLWALDNALITPHVANTVSLGMDELLALVTENCRRFATGEPLLAIVNPQYGY